MQIAIDPRADALDIRWGAPAPGQSMVVGDVLKGGVRLYRDDTGAVVGLEVLFWSRRTEAPQDVQVTVYSSEAAEVVPDDHPLARALLSGAAGSAVETDHEGRPVHEGTPMLSLAEAAARIGRERSWIARELAAGRLRGRKIGREWWTLPAWVDAYVAEHATRRQDRLRQRPARQQQREVA